ncbi:MAG: glycosyltransferase family 2 protein [Elusimicrobiales bacterium]|nr:glycosyltransferase family 2 protein [Elusimicrobiales bacterium]
MKLSLFIITFNEERNLARCLEAASGICDEIIIVDSGSTDGTKAIAEKYGAKFFTRKFDGYAAQKGYALAQCTGEWALSLDADEFIDEALKAEIRKIKEQPCGGNADAMPAGYELLRVNYFLGRRMKHSGLKNDVILRLARRDKAKFTGGLVHEKLEVSGAVSRISAGHIQHYSYCSIHNYFEKFNKYTTLGAAKKAESGRRPNLFISFIRIPFDFFRRYLLQLGILDGAPGFIWCAFSAFYPFVKYMKWWEADNVKDNLS